MAKATTATKSVAANYSDRIEGIDVINSTESLVKCKDGNVFRCHPDAINDVFAALDSQ